MKKENKSIIRYKQDFLEYLDVEKGLSIKSQETYSKLFDSFAGWLKENNLEDIKPHELTQKNVWNYRVYLSRKINPRTKEPLKRTTQNHYLIVLRGLLRFFGDRNIESLSSERIKLGKIRFDERSIKFLTLAQIKKLLNAPDVSTNIGLRDRAILEAFFSTGLRVAELVSLNREQIKINSEEDGLEVVIIGKGNRPRPVYFSPRALKWLKEYLSTREDTEKPLFVNYRRPKNADVRLSARSIENIVKKYAILSGLPSFTVPHSIRHSFATNMLAEGVGLREIQEFLGHKNIVTTQIYASVTSKRLKEIHRKFHEKSLEE